MNRLTEKIQAANHYAEDDARLRQLLSAIADDLCTRPQLVDIVRVLVAACPPSGMTMTYEAAARKILALMEPLES